MPAILVITGVDGSAGFATAGLETRELKDNEDISSMLLSIQAQGGYGLVIVDDRLLSTVSEQVMKRLSKKGLPIIIPVSLPSLRGAGRGESPVMKIIRKAIGYHIKIKRR